MMATKTAAIIVIIFFILGVLAPLSPCAKQYKVSGIMYKVDFENNMALIKGNDGSWWGMEGTHTYARGTHVIITIDDNGTDTIVDDKVIKVEEAR